MVKLGSNYNDTVFGIADGLTVVGGENAGNTDVDTLDLSNGTLAPVVGGDGYSVNLHSTTGFVSNKAGSVTQQLREFENAIGTAGRDTFIGNDGNNVIDGGAETDTVTYASVTTDAISVNLVP